MYFAPPPAPIPNQKHWKAQNTSYFAGIIAVSIWDLMQNQILHGIPYIKCYNACHLDDLRCIEPAERESRRARRGKHARNFDQIFVPHLRAEILVC